MRITRKGEVWDERPYREPTVEERAAWKAKRQARCPYNLDEVHTWSERMWIDWGERLMAREAGDRAIDNVEAMAVCRASRYQEAVQRWCREFMKHVQLRRMQNGYVDSTAEQERHGDQGDVQSQVAGNY